MNILAMLGGHHLKQGPRRNAAYRPATLFHDWKRRNTGGYCNVQSVFLIDVGTDARPVTSSNSRHQSRPALREDVARLCHTDIAVFLIHDDDGFDEPEPTGHQDSSGLLDRIAGLSHDNVTLQMQPCRLASIGMTAYGSIKRARRPDAFAPAWQDPPTNQKRFCGFSSCQLATRCRALAGAATSPCRDRLRSGRFLR
jgi:hypothetical protein